MLAVPICAYIPTFHEPICCPYEEAYHNHVATCDQDGWADETLSGSLLKELYPETLNYNHYYRWGI